MAGHRLRLPQRSTARSPSPFSSVLRVLLPFVLLTAALAALWCFPPGWPPALARRLWLLPFAAAVVAALLDGTLAPVALVPLALLAGALALFVRAAPGSARRRLAGTAALLLVAGAFLHLLPGFRNPLVLPPVRLTPDALPYRLHFNFDKAASGLLLVAFLLPRAATPAAWRSLLAATAPVAAVTVGILLAGAVLAGYVRFDPKFPPGAGLFLWGNLFFTCLAEEALFRGFVQARLAARWSHRPRGPHVALGAAAVLFGLAHAAGGPVYVALSTLAGLGYGAAWLRSGGRIEAAILTHFSVNALHFLGFTYPALAPPGGIAPG